jgi:hypothetical protein
MQPSGLVLQPQSPPRGAVELGNERFRVVAEEPDFEARSSVWPTIVEQSPAHSRRLKGSEE